MIKDNDIFYTADKRLIMMKRKSDLMSIGYILRNNICNQITCLGGLHGLEKRNRTGKEGFPCPLIDKCVVGEDITEEKLRSRAWAWIKENDVTKGELFPYLF